MPTPIVTTTPVAANPAQAVSNPAEVNSVLSTPTATPVVPVEPAPSATVVEPSPAKNSEPVVPKALFDRKVSEINTENKRLKQQLAEYMSDEEKAAQAKADQAAELSSLSKELTKLKQERDFLGQGMDAETAASMAEALAENDIATFMKIQKEYLARAEKQMEEKIKQSLLGAAPAPKAADVNDPKKEPGFALAQEIGKQRAESQSRMQSVLDVYRKK